MFGKLKNKLKDWVNKVSKENEVIEEEIIEEKVKKPKQEKKKKEKSIKDLKEETIDEELKKEVSKEEYSEPKLKFNVGKQIYEPNPEKSPKEKKSFFQKIISKKRTISPEEFREYSEDLEMILLENNVALEVAEKIINELEEKITSKELTKKEIQETLISTLKEIIEKVLVEPFKILKEIKEKKDPYVILFCGINGTGKTTHIAKIANLLKEKGITSVLAAGDTFRAAAVEQLKKHGENLDLKVISQDYGADPAAIGFDAIKYAKKNKIQVVLIDTAGRIHTATNLLREMQKIKKVCNPDRTIFVGESITGNDATDQVRAFNDNIGIDGIILSKADIDEKGGTALSVGYTTGKPIIFLGTGQNYKDIEQFDKDKFIEKLGL
jgi:fused signal recognition particle receptor